MSILKAIIIDDELPARELIKIYLKDNSQIEVVGEAENGFAGAKIINELAPDLVFLDIQMPKINGFEMLELIENQPNIIFCTAYDEYAIKAFDQNAIDYLLKPFAKERFLEAIKKVKQEDQKSNLEDANIESIDYGHPLQRIVVKDRKEIIIIGVQEILYIEAQDDYVAINTDKGKWLKQKTMKHYEKALNDDQFVRIHRKYILNIETISKLDKLGKETYMVLLKSGESIPVSSSGYQKLKLQLGI
jgi:two-component system LytT family response regulator